MTLPSLDWGTAREVLAMEDAEERATWNRLYAHVAAAERQLGQRRCLDALAELHAAADLETDLAGDCRAVGPLLDALHAELGLSEESTFWAWAAAGEES